MLLMVEEAMALSQGISRLNSYGEQLRTHLAAIAMSGANNRNYRHWRTECAQFLLDASRIKLKGSKKFDADDYIDNMLWHIDSLNDVKYLAWETYVEHFESDYDPPDFVKGDLRYIRTFINLFYEEWAEILEKGDFDKKWAMDWIDDYLERLGGGINVFSN